MSCRNRPTGLDLANTTQQEDCAEVDSQRCTREISYTPNFDSIFSNTHLPPPSSPLLNKTLDNAYTPQSPSLLQTNHGELMYPQASQTESSTPNNFSPAASQPARPVSQPTRPQSSQPVQQLQNQNSMAAVGSPSPHLYPPTNGSPSIQQQNQQQTSSQQCCSMSQHQAPTSQQQTTNHNGIYLQQQQQSTIPSNYSNQPTVGPAAVAVPNSLYNMIDIYPQSQPQSQMIPNHQMRSHNQQQATRFHNQPHLPQNTNYLQETRHRLIILPNRNLLDQNGTNPVRPIRRTSQQYVSQQVPHYLSQQQQNQLQIQSQQITQQPSTRQPLPRQQQQPIQLQPLQQPPIQQTTMQQQQFVQYQNQQQPIQQTVQQPRQRASPILQQSIHQQQPIQRPPYSNSVSMPPQPAVQQQTTATLARTYQNLARRPRGRLPDPIPPVSSTTLAQTQSVSSTTIPTSLVSKQHVGTQINQELMNKACQFDGRNVMINKSLNATVSVLDQITQTDDAPKPTFVDRACSPILQHHLQHLRTLQPTRTDIPVRRKTTAKRRKVEQVVEEKRKDPIDSDTEIDILE